MKIKVLFAALGLVVISAQAATHVFDVPEGQTKTFAEMLTAEGATLATSGDVIIKRGKGKLVWDNGYSTYKFTLTNEAGVVALTATDAANKKEGSIYVKDGASFSIETDFAQVLQKWKLYFAGQGTGVAPYLGALVCQKTNGNGQILYGEFVLTDDATIYTTTDIANYMFSASSTASYSILNMQNHTLTLRGENVEKTLFRPRWGWKITNAATIVLDNILFARHANSADTMDVYTIPRFKLINGAKISLDGYYYKKASEVDFDAGTTMGFKVSSPGAGGNTGATPTLKNLTGAPTIASATSSCTVTNLFTVRAADLAESHILTADSSTLSFGSACRVRIDDYLSTSWTKGEPVTIATAQTIGGTPTMDPAQADLFTVANTGTAITVTPTFSVVTLAGLGIQPGEANAEANAAALANNLSKIVDGTLLIVPSGDYYFGETFDLSGVTAANVILQGAASATDAACIHSTIKLGAATNFKIENVTVKGVNGPAVIATGTQGLTINSLTADAVVGTYGECEEPPTYPFVFDGVTDLKASGFAATNCGANKWTDQALYLGEGSQTEDSALREGEIVVEALKGKSSEKNPNWYTMVAVTNAFNLKDAAYANKTLVVTGDGATLDGTVNLIPLGVTNLVIRHGQYVARSNRALGVLKSPVEVKAGASLTIYDKNEGVNERRIRFAGEGVSADTPAIRLSGDADWNKVYKAKFEMTGDATIYNNCTGECGIFVYSKVYANGHTLTLKGVANSNYRFGRDCLWYGGGEVVVKSGVSVSSSTKGDNGYVIKEGGAPKFTFEGTSKFIPDSKSIFELIKDVSFANTATLTIKNATTPFDWTFVNLKGAPIVNTRIPSLTVTGTYLANKEDLVADKPLTLNGAFVWGAEAVADVDNADGVKDKTFIQAEGGITKKAKPGEVLKTANYTFYWAGTTIQKVGLPRGMKVLVR